MGECIFKQLRKPRCCAGHAFPIHHAPSPLDNSLNYGRLTALLQALGTGVATEQEAAGLSCEHLPIQNPGNLNTAPC